MTRPVRLMALTVLLAIASAGCGGSARVMVRAGTTVTEREVQGEAASVAERAEAEMECPIEDLVLENLRNGSYLVQGCGSSFTYLCVGRTCALDHRETVAQVTTTASWSDAHVSAIASRASTILTSCGVAPSEGLVVRLRLSRLGRVVRRDRASFSPVVASCVDRELGTVGLRGSVPEGRDVVLHASGGQLRPAEPTQSIGSIGGEPAAPATSTFP